MTSEAITISFGEKLRVTREKRGLSQQEAAKALCLDVTVIDALEKEAFDRLPAPVFVRGYIKNYADLLRLSIAHHNYKTDTISPSKSSEVSEKKSSVPSDKILFLKQLFLKSLNYLVMIVLLGLLFIWWHEREHAKMMDNSIIQMSAEENPFPRTPLPKAPDVMQQIFPSWRS